MSDTAAEAALLAKQALKEMALGQAAPTPDNFHYYYEMARSRLTGCPPPDRRDPDGSEARAARAAENSIKGVLAIMEAFLSNLGDLYPDNPSLREQVDILRDALEDPRDTARLISAKKSLARARAPQAHSHLTAAKMMARDMSELFLAQMGQAGQTTGELAERLAEMRRAVEASDSKEQIAAAVGAMERIASGAQASLTQARESMIATRARAEEALASVRHLEAQLVKASEEAKRDYLTGLLNRRGLDEELGKAFKRPGSEASPPTLALLDIDNFKTINDTMGHEAGDQALRALGAAITEILSTQGSTARMGGEEFLIVFPELDARQARKAVQGLQRALTTKFFMEAAGERLITFSAGIARRLPGETPSETISRADEAMYAAKRLGKNRVEICPANLPPALASEPASEPAQKEGQ